MVSNEVLNKDVIESLKYIANWANALREQLEERELAAPGCVFVEGVKVDRLNVIGPPVYSPSC